MGIHMAEMKNYFEAIDVDTQDASSIFDLIDTDESGGLSGAELVTSLLRLKGTAKAMQVALLEREVTRLSGRLRNQMHWVASLLETIRDTMQEAYGLNQGCSMKSSPFGFLKSESSHDAEGNYESGIESTTFGIESTTGPTASVSMFTWNPGQMGRNVIVRQNDEEDDEATL